MGLFRVMPGSLVVLQAAFIGVGLLLVLVNVRQSHGCLGRYDKSDEAMRRSALEHRLRSMEKEVKENSVILHKFLMSLETEFALSESLDLVGLKRECHDEAAAIVAKLAEDPPPPMPSFDAAGGPLPEGADDKYPDDDIFGGKDALEEEEFGAFPEEEPDLDIPPVEERSASCKQWRTQYGVSPGVSWGNLPLDLQSRWRTYDCDIYVQEAVHAMLQQQAPDDDFNIVGDISSLDSRSPIFD